MGWFLGLNCYSWNFIENSGDWQEIFILLLVFGGQKYSQWIISRTVGRKSLKLHIPIIHDKEQVRVAHFLLRSVHMIQWCNTLISEKKPWNRKGIWENLKNLIKFFARQFFCQKFDGKITIFLVQAQKRVFPPQKSSKNIQREVPKNPRYENFWWFNHFNQPF